MDYDSLCYALCRMAFMYDVDGCLIRKIKLLRINDLALTRDGTVMVMVTQEKLIKVQRLVFDGKDVRYHSVISHKLRCWL